MRTGTRGAVVRVVVIALALVATVALLRRVPEPEASAGRATTTTSAPASPTVARSSPPSPPPPPSPRAAASPVAEQWHRTAEAFATAYVDTTGGRDAWLQRLRPLVSTEVHRGFQHTDIANLPGGTPGHGRLVVDDEFAGGTMRVPLTGGAIWGVDVTVSLAADGREVVTQVLPVESEQARP